MQYAKYNEINVGRFLAEKGMQHWFGDTSQETKSQFFLSLSHLLRHPTWNGFWKNFLIACVTIFLFQHFSFCFALLVMFSKCKAVSQWQCFVLFFTTKNEKIQEKGREHSSSYFCFFFLILGKTTNKKRKTAKNNNKTTKLKKRTTEENEKLDKKEWE